MLRIGIKDVHGDQVFTFTGDAVTIGRHPTNDLVLSKPAISRRHAKLVVDRLKQEVVIEDSGSTSGVHVAGRKIRGPQVVSPDDEIRIGDVVVRARLDRLVPEDVTDETEQGLLDTLRVNPRDDETRAVYADWLEERGKVAQADFLRTQVAARRVSSADDPAFAAASARLAALASRVGIGWRARVAMTFVEPTTCGAVAGAKPLGFELACPTRWDEMAPTALDGVRSCRACKKDVVYCATIDEARTYAEEGGCVAIDIGISRSPDDLTPPRRLMMGRVAPNFAARGKRQE